MATKRKVSHRHKKIAQKTKAQHPKEFAKVYWPYLPIMVVVVLGMFFGSVKPLQSTHSPATLAYASEMSASVLLSATNQQRAANGLPALSLNGKLNASAQAKSNDMVAQDYWSHNTPSGQEPWVFFQAAGYAYQKAGENLAYGFTTSADTVTGWMNSPSHRANILDSQYTEVGFGFTNSPNFVGTGEETVVVAHYGLPVAATPVPAPAAPAVEPQSQPQSLQAQDAEEVAETAPVVEPEPEPEREPVPASRVNQPINTDAPVPDDTESTNITRLQQLTGGNAPWSAVALSVVALLVVGAWLFKHALLVKRFILRGEHFVAHHPLLDLFVVIVAALAVYMSQSSGVVL